MIPEELSNLVHSPGMMVGAGNTFTFPFIAFNVQ